MLIRDPTYRVLLNNLFYFSKPNSFGFFIVLFLFIIFLFKIIYGHLCGGLGRLDSHRVE